MNIRRELNIWKDRLSKKEDLTEDVSFYWVEQYLLPMMEALLNRIEELEERGGEVT